MSSAAARSFCWGNRTCAEFDGVLHDVEWDDPALKCGRNGVGLVVELGKGATFEYSKTPDPEVRDLVGRAMARLLPDPAVSVSRAHDVDVSLRRLPDGRLTVHLVNTSGPHARAGIIESIEPVGPLSVEVKVENLPNQVLLQSGSRPCEFTYGNGKVSAAVPQIDIYDIPVLD